MMRRNAIRRWFFQQKKVMYTLIQWKIALSLKIKGGHYHSRSSLDKVFIIFFFEKMCKVFCIIGRCMLLTFLSKVFFLVSCSKLYQRCKWIELWILVFFIYSCFSTIYKFIAEVTKGLEPFQ